MARETVQADVGSAVFKSHESHSAETLQVNAVVDYALESYLGARMSELVDRLAGVGKVNDGKFDFPPRGRRRAHHTSRRPRRSERLNCDSTHTGV